MERPSLAWLSSTTTMETESNGTMLHATTRSQSYAKMSMVILVLLGRLSRTSGFLERVQPKVIRPNNCDIYYLFYLFIRSEYNQIMV